MRNPSWSLVSKTMFAVCLWSQSYSGSRRECYSIREASTTSGVALTGIIVSCSGAYASNVKQTKKNNKKLHCQIKTVFSALGRGSCWCNLGLLWVWFQMANTVHSQSAFSCCTWNANKWVFREQHLNVTTWRPGNQIHGFSLCTCTRETLCLENYITSTASFCHSVSKTSDSWYSL